MTLLLLKLGLTPGLIALATIVSRRWGPAVGGLLIALPFTSFPVLLVLALDMGTDFAARATEGSLAGAISLATFCLVYGRAGARLGWMGSFLAATAAYAGVALLVRWIGDVPLVVLIGAAVAAPSAALLLLPRSVPLAAAMPTARWDLPARMLVGACVVLGITSFSTILGPQLSGVLATFPVYITVLAVFLHRREGLAPMVHLLRGAVSGMFATIAFFVVIRLAIVPLGIAVAFPAGLATALAIQAVALTLLRRATPGRLPPPTSPGGLQ